MAGNIQGVNRKQLEAEYNTFWETDSTMGKGFVQLKNELDNLKKYWTGKRINSVYTVWNNACTDLLKYKKFISETSVIVVEEINKQYAAMEDYGKSSNLNSGAKVIESYFGKIALTDANVVKFLQSNVLTSQKNILNALNQIERQSATLVSSLDKIAKYSDSLAVVQSSYKKQIVPINNYITKFCSDMRNALNQAVTAVQTTERNNASDASRVTLK